MGAPIASLTRHLSFIVFLVETVLPYPKKPVAIIIWGPTLQMPDKAGLVASQILDDQTLDSSIAAETRASFKMIGLRYPT